MSRLSKKNKASVAQLLVSGITAANNRNSFSPATDRLAALVCSLESADEGDLVAVQTATDELEIPLKEVVANTANEIEEDEEAAIGPNNSADAIVTEAGMESAKIIAAASSNLSGYIQKAKPVAAMEGMAVLSELKSTTHGSLQTSERNVSTESYDNKELSKFLESTIAYNLLAPRQDTFCETLFPTVVGTPDQSGFVANISRIGVYQGAIHKLDGNIESFQKRNMLEAYRDYKVMENEATKLVPIIVDGTNDTHFVDDALIAPEPITIAGESLFTQPLKFGKTNLISIASHPGLISQGLMNHSDSIAPGGSLTSLHVLVKKAASPDEVIKFDVSNAPRNQFLKRPEGNSNDVGLEFRTEALKIDKNTRLVGGGASAILADIAANELEVRLSTRLSVDLNLETGTSESRAWNTEAVRLVGADGAELALSNAALDGVTFELIGWVPDLNRTNSNRRSFGKLLDIDKYSEVYTVSPLAPFSVQKPINEEDKGLDVEALVQATHVAIVGRGVTTLLNYAEQIKMFYSGNAENPLTADYYTGGDLQGIARFLVTPYYDHVEIDLPAVISSLTSKDKLKDVQGHFTGVISECAYRMLQLSGYRAALESVTGNSAVKPKLCIATDDVLPQFMMIQGDPRTSGVTMDHVVVSSSSDRMYGKIFLTFVTDSTGFSPLNFGNLIWIPEVISAIPMNRSGAINHETMVQPCFRHIPNLPVITEIDVLGLTEVIRNKSIVSTKEVA